MRSGFAQITDQALNMITGLLLLWLSAISAPGQSAAHRDVSQPQEAGMVGEPGAADAVVDENARLVHGPPLAARVLARMVDLAGYGFLFVRNAVLFGRFASVDC